MLSVVPSLAYLILNLDPTLHLGPLPIHWYGLAYVVGISVGLWAMLRYAKRLGLDPEQVYPVFWWAALGGLIGGRLYFVIQQPDLVDHYLKQPLNIIAVWDGGMAFFGAIFLGLATVAFVSWRKQLPIWLALDMAAFFAAVGQIFGRFGNLVNGDILGYQAGTLVHAPNTCLNAPCIGFVSDPHILPWAMVYANPHAFAPLYTPFQPAAAYEMLLNLVVLALLFPLRLRLPRIKMGLVSLVYLAGYAISQIVVFFFRGTEPTTPFLGITIFKQAQWTGIGVLLALIPYGVLLLRTSRPWNGIAQGGSQASIPAPASLDGSVQTEQPLEGAAPAPDGESGPGILP
jgi:phosphatidylglycerol:prolipoprotein diacylglycerol transferase